jgi:hypothetical protein
MGKHNIKKIPKSSSSSVQLELMYTNLCGPKPIALFSWSWYFTLFTNDYNKYNKYSWIFITKKKLKILFKFKILKGMTLKTNLVRESIFLKWPWWRICVSSFHWPLPKIRNITTCDSNAHSSTKQSFWKENLNHPQQGLKFRFQNWST